MNMCDCGECEDCTRAILINERDRRLAAEDREATLREKLAAAERERDEARQWIDQLGRARDGWRAAVVTERTAHGETRLVLESTEHRLRDYKNGAEALAREVRRLEATVAAERQARDRAEAALSRARELLTKWIRRRAATSRLAPPVAETRAFLTDHANTPKEPR